MIINQENNQNRAQETILLLSSYKVIWDHKLLCLIHKKCGKRFEVKKFKQGYLTPHEKYQKYVKSIITKHKCHEKEKTEQGDVKNEKERNFI